MSDSSTQGPVSAGSVPGSATGASASGTDGSAGVGDNIRRQAQGAKESAKRNIKNYGNEMLGAARERARGFADEQKRTGAEQVDCVARAIDKAAEELSAASPQLEGPVRNAAAAVGGVAETLRERSLEELGEQLGDMARRQPLTLFFGAAAAGFVLARFLRTSDHALQNTASGAAPADAAAGTHPYPAAAAGSPPDSADPGELASAAAAAPQLPSEPAEPMEAARSMLP